MKAVALLTGIGTVSLCFAIGFAAGKYRPAPAGSASRDGARAEPVTALALGEGAVADVRKAMSARGGTFIKRYRSLLMAIDRAENEELPDLYRYLEHGRGLVEIRKAFVERWIERDPKGALREALDSEFWDSDWDGEVLIAACRREYPEWTWETLLASEAKPSGPWLLWRFIEEELRMDGRLAVGKLMAMNDRGLRNEFAAALAMQLAESPESHFFYLLEHLPLKNFDRHDQMRIVEEATRSDPTEMAQFVSEMESGQSRRLAAQAMAAVWAEDDPAATRDWIESSDRFDEFDREVLRAETGLVKAFGDPRAALARCLEIRSPETRSGLIADALVYWADDDEASATAWMNENLDGRMLREARAELERASADPFGLDP